MGSGSEVRAVSDGRSFPKSAKYSLLIEFNGDRTRVFARARILSGDGVYGLEEQDVIDVTDHFRGLLNQLDRSSIVRGEEVMS